MTGCQKLAAISGLPAWPPKPWVAPALAEDPAVTKLYALVQFLLNRDENARSWLTARVEDFSPELAEACNSGAPRTTLDGSSAPI